MCFGVCIALCVVCCVFAPWLLFVGLLVVSCACCLFVVRCLSFVGCWLVVIGFRLFNVIGCASCVVVLSLVVNLYSLAVALSVVQV